MNIIIVTCPSLSSARVPLQVSQLKGAFTKGLVSRLHILSMDDHEARHLANIPYKPDQWCSDIDKGWDVFRQNIISVMERNGSLHALSKVLTPYDFFPSRELTLSEHSIAYRHILAIQYIALSTSPCLVLEDDALINDEPLFLGLLESFDKICKHRIFYDLSDDYIPHGKSVHRLLKIGNLTFIKQPSAVTRTLIAYAMAPSTARLLINLINHYSLPIDMQLQVLLTSLRLPGISMTKSPFRHGSKTNEMLSSVSQC